MKIDFEEWGNIAGDGWRLIAAVAFIICFGPFIAAAFVIGWPIGRIGRWLNLI